jgi:hypothetical protein
MTGHGAAGGRVYGLDPAAKTRVETADRNAHAGSLAKLRRIKAGTREHMAMRPGETAPEAARGRDQAMSRRVRGDILTAKKL